MLCQPTDISELSKGPLFAYWKSREETVGPCDGCGRRLSLVVDLDIASKALIALCTDCCDLTPTHWHCPPGSRRFTADFAAGHRKTPRARRAQPAPASLSPIASAVRVIMVSSSPAMGSGPHRASTRVVLRNSSLTDHQSDTFSIRLCYLRWTAFGGGRQVRTMASPCRARHPAWSPVDGCSAHLEWYPLLTVQRPDAFGLRRDVLRV
jgi:hypothetical protein